MTLKARESIAQRAQRANHDVSAFNKILVTLVSIVNRQSFPMTIFSDCIIEYSKI